MEYPLIYKFVSCCERGEGEVGEEGRGEGWIERGEGRGRRRERGWRKKKDVEDYSITRNRQNNHESAERSLLTTSEHVMYSSISANTFPVAFSSIGATGLHALRGLAYTSWPWVQRDRLQEKKKEYSQEVQLCHSALPLTIIGVDWTSKDRSSNAALGSDHVSTDTPS